MLSRNPATAIILYHVDELARTTTLKGNDIHSGRGGAPQIVQRLVMDGKTNEVLARVDRD